MPTGVAELQSLRTSLQPPAGRTLSHPCLFPQAWIYWNPGQREACVAFRGTEQGKWKDILTDLHLVPAPLDPERVAAAPRRAGAPLAGCLACMLGVAAAADARLVLQLPCMQREAERLHLPTHACLSLRAPHAALADLAPEQKPGRLSRLLSKVEQAKERVAAERAAAEEEGPGASAQVRALAGRYLAAAPPACRPHVHVECARTPAPAATCTRPAQHAPHRRRRRAS